MKLNYLEYEEKISLSCINSTSTVQVIFFDNNLDLIDLVIHTQFTQCESIYGHSIIKKNYLYYIISDAICEKCKRCYESLDGNLSPIEIIDESFFSKYEENETDISKSWDNILICSKVEFLFSLNNSCLKTCPHNYEIENNKCIFKSFVQDTI